MKRVVFPATASGSRLSGDRISQRPGIGAICIVRSIDGVPAKFQIDQRAMVGDKDVTAQLDQFKLPLLPIGSREIRVANLPEATRTKLADQGLLMPVRTDDKGHQQYAVAWVAKTSALRQQTFPPERGVIVEHQAERWRAGVRSRPPPP